MTRFLKILLVGSTVSALGGSLPADSVEAPKRDRSAIVARDSDEALLLPRLNRQPAILHEPSNVPVGDQAALYVGIGETRNENSQSGSGEN